VTIRCLTRGRSEWYRGVMCGRFTNRLTWRQLHELYRITEPEIGPGQREPELKPRFNIAPTQNVPVVRAGKDGGRELALLRWGLVPSWADDPEIGYRTINAKAETVAEKPAFRAAFKRRRCLVPADGFYERKVVVPGSSPRMGKQPYCIAMKGGAPFAMAGLLGSLGEGRRARRGELGDRELHAHHLRRQRALRRDPQPHAGDPRSRRSRRLADQPRHGDADGAPAALSGGGSG